MIKPGQSLGHYRIERKIGEGHLGVVYEALDTELHRPVAVKVLSTPLAGDPSLMTERLAGDVRQAALISHPNIARVHGAGDEAGVPYVVMELLKGKTLRDWIRHRPLEVGAALRMATGLAAGLARAHEAGVVHRDLRPENILIADGRAVILDLGLGALTEDAHGRYVSPEQAEGKEIDGRADIFALGIVLYEMLTRRHPFGGESPGSTLTSIVRDPPPPLSSLRPDLPPRLDAIVARCLAKGPAGRYQSAGALHAALLEIGATVEETATSRPTSGIRALLRRPAIAIPAVILLLAAIAAAAWFALNIG